MTIVGWHASHEQVLPSRLLAAVQRAEAAGFDAAMSSDHFSPWGAAQGESGFAWSWLGAAMATTTLPFGVVNAPGQRYHPAIIAQAAATLTEMFPGRLWVALGTGEASNEHITGAGLARQGHPQPPAGRVRRRHAGPLRRGGGHPPRAGDGRPGSAVDAAGHPPALVGAAVSAQTAGWVGGWADGLITVGSDPQALRPVLDAFREGGGEGKPAYVQVHLSWASTDDAAAPSPTSSGAPTCSHLRCAGTSTASSSSTRPPASSTADDVAGRICVSSDPAFLLDHLTGLVDVGFDGIWLHHVGQEQLAFIDTFGEHVVPELRAVRT